MLRIDVCVKTTRVLAYDVGSNLCANCKIMDDILNKKILSLDEHTNWKNSHSDLCPAKYSNISPQ